MAWKTGTNAPLGLPAATAITNVGDPPKIAVGTIAQFVEDTQGPGDLIYLPGVASLLAGDIVSYDLLPGAQATTRYQNVANTGRPVAVAVGAPQAGQYGWFQISGLAVVNALAGAVAGAVMGSATAGSVASAALAGGQVLNARFSSAVGTPSAGKAYVMLNRPFIQGQIT